MAQRPLSDEELIDTYGPHLNEAPPGGWDAGIDPDRTVKTHCCFCGQQCGIKLKVKDNEVVGFEPWYEFPFNEGKLCPKGVKRYLQGNHPDRLLHPLERDPSSPDGFRTTSWDHALDRVVAESSESRPNTARMRSPCSAGSRSPTRRATSSASSPAWAWAPRTSTTTAASAWSPQGSATRRRSASTGRPTRGATFPSPTSCGWPARTSPRRSPSPPATCGGPVTAGPSSSCRTLGWCRWLARRTCSCRCGPAPTRPCSVPSSTS